MNHWDQLKKQARQLEAELDGKLSALQQSRPGSSADMDMEPLLNRLNVCVQEMQQFLDQQYPTGTTRNPTMMHTLQRHRDVLYEYTKEWRKYRENRKQMLEQQELLNSVQQEIHSFKNASLAQQAADPWSEERRRVDGAQRMTDTVIDAAYETHSTLINQREKLSGITRRMGGLAERFPVIRQLLLQIQAKKRRDTIIMGVVIGLCLAGIWFMM